MIVASQIIPPDYTIMTKTSGSETLET